MNINCLRRSDGKTRMDRIRNEIFKEVGIQCLLTELEDI
jgi:hypothetical protein